MTVNIRQLPEDILADITYRANFPISQRLSKGIQNRSVLYLRKECERYISDREYELYIQKDPAHLSLFNYQLYESRPDSILHATVNIGLNMLTDWGTIYVDMNMDDVDINYELESYAFSGVPEYDADVYYLDVLSSYNIYKTRLSCFNLLRNFAKDMTREQFLNTLEELEHLHDSKKVFIIYLYLYGNAFVLNILAPKPKLTQPIPLGDDAQPLPGEMNRADIKIISGQILVLREKILQAIEKFD
jgi:hypothetical protein